MGVRAQLYVAHGEDRKVLLTDDDVRKLTDGTLLWVDIDRPQDADLAELKSAMQLPESISTALAEGGSRPRLVRSDRAVLITVLSAGSPDTEDDVVPVHLVAMRNAVISVHEGPAPFLDEFATEVGDEARVGLMDTATFLGGLIDTMLAHFDRQVEGIEREIDKLDEVALRGDDPDDFLQSMVRLRRRAADLRRTLAPQRETLGPLSRADFELHDELGKSWPALTDRLERTIGGVERARELLIGSSDIYMGRVSQRENEVVKRLTVVSTVLLPAVVLASALGMNFNLPFFQDPGNFWIAVFAMVALSVVILIAARLRNWI